MRLFFVFEIKNEAEKKAVRSILDIQKATNEAISTNSKENFGVFWSYMIVNIAFLWKGRISNDYNKNLQLLPYRVSLMKVRKLLGRTCIFYLYLLIKKSFALKFKNFFRKYTVFFAEFKIPFASSIQFILIEKLRIQCNRDTLLSFIISHLYKERYIKINCRFTESKRIAFLRAHVTYRLVCELHVSKASKSFEYGVLRFDTENSTCRHQSSTDADPLRRS